jgi:hypothetical protein
LRQNLIELDLYQIKAAVFHGHIYVYLGLAY